MAFALTPGLTVEQLDDGYLVVTGGGGAGTSRTGGGGTPGRGSGTAGFRV